MAVFHSDLVPGLGASVRSLVAELRGRRVPTFIARDEHDATKLSVVEHLTLDGAAKSTALARVSVLASVPNPRLTRIRGAIERPRGIDVVSDYIDGERLSEVATLLREGGTAIPTLCALRLVSDVLAGLHALHGIPEFAATGHGNLSMGTVMVGLDGRVRLIELVGLGVDAKSGAAESLLAPEVLESGVSSPRGDLFAAGTILAALLADGDHDPAADERAIHAVAERAVARDPADRFESAAAMLSALASTFRGAPSHADVARLMVATVGEAIRARRAAAEKAPMLDDAHARDALAPPLSMPVVFASEPLPGSRRASPWPGTLQAQSAPPSAPRRDVESTPPSSSPPSSRRTDRPPPGFGYAPASGAPLPLGFIPDVVASTSPASARAVRAVRVAPQAVPPSSSAVAAAAPVAPPAPAERASAVTIEPVVAAAPVAPPQPPAPPQPSPPPSARASARTRSAVASTAPNPETAPNSQPTDSWRYASAKPVEPPRRAVTLPVPDESIIIHDSEAAAERTVKMSAPPVLASQASVPPSVRHIPSTAPSSTSSKLPATDVPALRAPSRPTSKLLPMALGGVALVAVAAGAFGLLARGKRSADIPSAAALSRVPTPGEAGSANAAAAAPPAAGQRCPEGTALIEGGAFTMGSDAPDGTVGARPAHVVTLSAFCMDVVEVSVAKFKACSDRGDCKRGLVTNEWAGITAAERTAHDPLCTLRDPVAMASHPINCVDWERADIYCTARNARLPTEAEWELAARGRDGRAYPWGNDEPSAALVNACGAECTAWAGKNSLELGTVHDGLDGWAATAPGKTFPAGATPDGVADLAGNVAEWVADAYAPYSAAAQNDPVVPNGELRVVRGGSFLTGKRAALATTYRTREKPTKRSSTIGFRCVSPLGAPAAGR